MTAKKDRDQEPSTSSIDIAGFKRQVAEIREKKLMDAKRAEVMRKRATARKEKE